MNSAVVGDKIHKSLSFGSRTHANFRRLAVIVVLLLPAIFTMQMPRPKQSPQKPQK